MAKQGAGSRKGTTGQSSNAGGATKRTRRGKQFQPEPLLPLPTLNLDLILDLFGAVVAVLGLLTALAMLPSTPQSNLQPGWAAQLNNAVQSWLALLTYTFGELDVLIPIILMGVGGWVIMRKFERGPALPWYRILGLFLFTLALFGILGLVEEWEGSSTFTGLYGGALGVYSARAFKMLVGTWGALVALIGIGIMGALYIFELSLADILRAGQQLFKRLPRRPPAPSYATNARPPNKKATQLPLPDFSDMFQSTVQFVGTVRAKLATVGRSVGRRLRPSTPDGQPDVPAPSDNTPAPDEKGAERGVRPPTAPLNKHTAPTGPLRSAMPMATTAASNWRLPPWRNFLSQDSQDTTADDDVRLKTHIIEDTLRQFGVPAKVVEINRGPTVTQFGVEPGFLVRKVRGEEHRIKIKVAAITNLHNDLALALAAQRIRIEAPVPGRNYVGIEVPNDKAVGVTLGEVMGADEFERIRAPLRLALGRDVMGNAVVADLAKMPHLLIAGSTGSGKSVCINTVIASLICYNTPDQLKLLMVDPKRVELVGYNGIPHLITPVVTDIERVVGSLTWAVSEMERRYRIFSQKSMRNLLAYNGWAVENGERPLPYIVIIIDELADLMMAAGAQVEALIIRLAQMARATGIHLILATQRPSVDVVTGLIKANFPARIAFAVTSQIDSRVILDRIGAESLLGRGDMLYHASDSGSPVRAQGCYIGDDELAMLNEHWLRQAVQSPTPAIQSSNTVAAVQSLDWDELLKSDSEEEDDLLPKARELVAQVGSASISMLQRRLRVGYARAARIVDLLEQEGTIGSGNGPGKTRTVLSATPSVVESDDSDDFIFDD